MKAGFTIARVLLGLMFTIFGANGFLHFIPQPALPHGFAMEFMAALFGSGFYALVFATQLVAGILLLVGRYVPFALALLAPVIANILVFHLTMEPAGFLPGTVALALWIACVYRAREHFVPLFTSDTLARG